MPGVYIQDLYVHESLRGTGLGKRLVQHVVGLSGAWGAGYLRLAVDAENAAGQGFYNRIGMHWAAEDRIFVIDGEAFSSLAEPT